MWYEESVFYQIYPLGLCGAPDRNDGIIVPRIRMIKEWIPYLKGLGISAIYFSPVFQSDSHGYDTRDFRTIDCRLGTNDDFTEICSLFHEHGIRVIIDGVFNHVGRGFWAFQDVLRERWNSEYKDWFDIRFDQDNARHDGFSYEGWEGHYELVKLNLRNPSVKKYLFDSIGDWIDRYNIDGLRLDVAYCLDKSFLNELRSFCSNKKHDFYLLGEIIHGDYRSIMNESMCHSSTNYEVYKGLFSSFNDNNLFEIAYSLNRQFGVESWSLYKGMKPLNFVDNHDVDRIASVIHNPHHVLLVYGLLFAIPGIPCIYYGSEWGTQGVKSNGSDKMLRPYVSAPENTHLTSFIRTLAYIRRENKVFCFGTYKQLFLTNRQFVFERTYGNERVIVALNSDSKEFFVSYKPHPSSGVNLITGKNTEFNGGFFLEPYSITYWKVS
jgi:glycosidase